MKYKRNKLVLKTKQNKREGEREEEGERKGEGKVGEGEKLD